MIDAIGSWLRKRLGLGQPFPVAEPPAGATLNEIYDYQTARVLERVLEPRSSCIDVGCHVGAIMDLMLHFAPEGRHYGFEPLPHLFADLARKYAGNPHVVLNEVALSEVAGETTFQHVVTNPGYSGIKRRRYDRPHEDVVEIRVKLARLDDVVPAEARVRLVKIDVEGAEMGVLKGGIETLRRSRPFIVFEHGLGAADHYGTRPEQVHDFFAALGLQVSTMGDWLDGRPPLSRAAMADQFDRGVNYYFLAHP